MARTLLYYPTFRLPSDQWLKNALLYWDSIGTIVPKRLSKMVLEDEVVNYLSDNDAYKRFDPKAVVNDFDLSTEMLREFVNRLDSQELNLVECSKTDDYELFPIAFDKMFHMVWSELRRRGLTDSNFDGGPILLKKPAALLYMGILAKYLSSTSTEGYVQPGTNLQLYEDLTFKANSNIPAINSISMTLRRIIPSVHEDTSIRKIIEFKKQRRDELLVFRGLIDDIHHSLSECSSPEEASYQIARYKEQIELGVSTIRRQLSENKIKHFVGTLRTIFSAKSPAWLGMLAGGGVGATTALAGSAGAAIATTSLGFVAGAAIEIANYKLGAREKLVSLEKGSPYSYLYLAQKAHLIP